ncbi:serine/threonine protein kinase [Nocardia uniformis]|uniref:Serine/threonine protein kinase n=1 Tax=Nocardia uniformis TaxID=53432 RepID=A0A849CEZ4_9NOCA|nr:serine/threonine-protein kinase [Nocardia uniformis]NNH71901.1 serine/threonine protein kinase [Nocardia uniformis]
MTIRPLTPDDRPQIGRYRILGELGSGGMGRVLLGVGADGRLVAVKQVHAHLLHEVEYRARFRREVTATTRVSGAFTAPVIDFDVDSPDPWLAAVFVVGLPLDKAVSEYGPLPVPAVRRLAAGLASALQAIHQAGLIHRDLKPANVLLAADGPRVIDFGIASISENPSGLTETGSVLGSPAFMSPEQTLADRLTPASDVFSLGSVLMMAATGASPFAAPSLAYTLFNIAHTQPQLESLPPELRSLIEPCLHKDPAARPTPAQILDYLGDPMQHELPWPQSVHHEIDRQHSELVALTADPNATSVLPGARRSARVGAGAGNNWQQGERGRGRRTIALTALSALLVLMLAVTAAVVWVRGGDDTAQAAPQELTLAQLREVDACAWLKKAVGEALPADVAGDFPTDVAEWKLRPHSWWGCSSVRLGERYMYFRPGAHLYGISTASTGGTIPNGSYGAGQPVMGRSDAYMCERSIRTAGDLQWGLTIEAGSNSCQQLDYIILRLAAVIDIPRLSDARSSLASVDPCALADPATLGPLIGALPDLPSAFSAHSCTWEGLSSVEITTNRSAVIDADDPVIDLGDGRRLVAPKSTVASICNREYVFRQIGDEYEVMAIKVQGGGDNQQVCAVAESVARTAVDRLPEVK